MLEIKSLKILQYKLCKNANKCRIACEGVHSYGGLVIYMARLWIDNKTTLIPQTMPRQTGFFG